jgi:hypothetical protein
LRLFRELCRSADPLRDQAVEESSPISQFLDKISQIRNFIGTQPRLPIRTTGQYQALSGKTQDTILLARYMLEFLALLVQDRNQTEYIDLPLPYLDRNHLPTGNIVRYYGKQGEHNVHLS